MGQKDAKSVSKSCSQVWFIDLFSSWFYLIIDIRCNVIYTQGFPRQRWCALLKSLIFVN